METQVGYPIKPQEDSLSHSDRKDQKKLKYSKRLKRKRGLAKGRRDFKKENE